MTDKMCDDLIWKIGATVKANAVEFVMRYNCFAILLNLKLSVAQLLGGSCMCVCVCVCVCACVCV